MRRTTTLAAGVMAAAYALLAQDTPKPTTPYTSVDRPQLTALPTTPIPPRLSECESQVCGVWEFNGQVGEAKWASGAVAALSVERFDSDAIVIRRTDTGGSTPGLTAIYTGKLTGNRIDGDVTWSWSGFRNKTATGKWYATIGAPETANTIRTPRQNRTPSASVNNPGAALLMMILGIQPDGSQTPIDPTDKISQLRRAAEAARDACTHLDPHYYDGGACEARRDNAENRLHEALGQRGAEIDQLQEAHNKLAPECKAGNQESCKKLAQVDARLEKDRKFQIDSLFPF